MKAESGQVDESRKRRQVRMAGHLQPPGGCPAHADGDDGGGGCDDQQRQRGHRHVEGILEHRVNDGTVVQVERGEGGAIARDVVHGVHAGDDVILETSKPAAEQTHSEHQGHQDAGVSVTGHRTFTQ